MQDNTKNSLKGSLALLAVVVLYGMYGVYSRMIGIDFRALSQTGASTKTLFSEVVCGLGIFGCGVYL